MANQTLFRGIAGALAAPAGARNHEGAPAYRMEPRHALAQYAATGCLNGTYYASAGTQLATILHLCAEAPPEAIARTAVYCRERGHMKDVPALLCAVLSVREPKLMEWVFDRVVDNGRMLRTFVQIIRSGVVGRKSFGSLPKRVIRRWLDARDDDAIFRASVGQSPSLADIVKMVHPKPLSETRSALYGWLLGRSYQPEALPEIARRFETYKRGDRTEVPEVPFQMLTALDLGRAEWIAIARHASWQTTRMNLSTFARHGVFTDPEVTGIVRDRLRDEQQIRAARVLPYQLLAAYRTAGDCVPSEIREALHAAAELAMRNVPAVQGKVYVCPDVSGSMASPVTGTRRGATSAVRCVDVAALVAAAFLRTTDAEVLPFESWVVPIRLERRESILTTAARLAAIGGGGTNCSAPLVELNRRGGNGDLVVFVSDHESWIDAGRGRGTAMLAEWRRYRQRNPRARLVCIDVQPTGTSQVPEAEEILNVGGFSDEVFVLIGEFVAGRLSERHWVDVIDAVEL